MHLLILEGTHLETEFRQKFGPDHEYTFWSSEMALSAEETEDQEAWLAEYELQQAELAAQLTAADVIFDLANVTDALEIPYGKVLFVEASTEGLAGNYFGDGGERTTPIYGFCGLPTLLNRPLLEVSMVAGGDDAPLRRICYELGTDFRLVQDRIGLATPRVLAMLINEACYTLQEGTAEARDIDWAMRLGTNYPQGPLAWADAIGAERIVEVLDALWEDTHDGRYRVCPLLRTRALLGEGLAAATE